MTRSKAAINDPPSFAPGGVARPPQRCSSVVPAGRQENGPVRGHFHLRKFAAPAALARPRDPRAVRPRLAHRDGLAAATAHLAVAPALMAAALGADAYADARAVDIDALRR